MSLIVNTSPRPKALAEHPTVVDIGPGIRPMNWYRPERHICVEPFKPYADELRAAGYEVVEETAEQYLPKLMRLPGRVLVCLLDVVEHMTQDVGDRVILTLQNVIQPTQTCVITPYGFLPQEGDAWGMGGDEWQKHRSGYTPQNFRGWKIEEYEGLAPHKFFSAVTP